MTVEGAVADRIRKVSAYSESIKGVAEERDGAVDALGAVLEQLDVALKSENPQRSEPIKVAVGIARKAIGEAEDKNDG